MFEPFTEPAREAIVRAQEEARSLGHNHIGTEHVLLGLVATPESQSARCLESQGVDHDQVCEALIRIIPPPGDLAAEALETVGIDLSAVRNRVKATFGSGALDQPPGRRGRRGRLASGHIPFTPRVKKVLELSPAGGGAAAPQVHRRRSHPAWSTPRRGGSCGAAIGRRGSRP